MKLERVLKLKLDEAIDFFGGRKWKLFQLIDLQEGRLLKLEVPIGQTESYVVELPFDEGEFLNEAIRVLKANGWMAWITELYNYGFGVVTVKKRTTDNAQYFAYSDSDGITQLRDLVSYLGSAYSRVSKVALFGHSAGGAIVARQVELDSTIASAVFVSAPVDAPSCTSTFMHSAAYTSGIASSDDIRLQYGNSDPYYDGDYIYNQMARYYSNAVQNGKNAVRDIYSGNLHDHYLDSSAATIRNNAKSWMWNN